MDGNCEGQGTKEMPWEVEHALWEMKLERRKAGEGRGWREADAGWERIGCVASEVWNADLIK